MWSELSPGERETFEKLSEHEDERVVKARGEEEEIRDEDWEGEVCGAQWKGPESPITQGEWYPKNKDRDKDKAKNKDKDIDQNLQLLKGITSFIWGSYYFRFGAELAFWFLKLKFQS